MSVFPDARVYILEEKSRTGGGWGFIGTYTTKELAMRMAKRTGSDCRVLTYRLESEQEIPGAARKRTGR